jgi:polysaccharide pyruvyl transferase WcaK-like protein/MoaA/NifB/PqqE/SkfB family radical SAM enzyme
MCKIWESKKSEYISPEELRRGLRNPLYSEVVAVGLNGGEPTLRKDLNQLTSVLFDELPKLQSISLITNAYKYEEVIARIAEVGSVVQKRGGVLDVMVSLDGFGDVHDRVRSKPGNFERAEKVIDYLQSSPLVTSVRIGCTIIKENVYGLADLFEYCQSKDLYIKYRLGIPHQRLYTQELVEPYALSAEDKYYIAEFLEGLIAHYETGVSQKFFYRSLIDQLVLNVPRRAGCDWQHRGATITSKGELLYCAVQSKVLGRIQYQDSEKAYFGNAGHLAEIVKTKCASCNHDYVGLPSKSQYIKQLATMAVTRLRIEPMVRQFYSASKLDVLRQRMRYGSRLARMNNLGCEQLPAAAVETGVRQVLICGWYGTETLGDKAILGGVISAIRQTLGLVDFTLVSLFPYVSEISRRQMVEIRDCRIVTASKGVCMAGSMDLVVFGGGPLMAIDELADMEAIFRAASKRGVPTLIAGCGVGPLGSSWHNASIKSILSLASIRIYRDDRSRGIARGLGIDTSNDSVAEDPAFTWLREKGSILSNTVPGSPRVLLLGLRDFPCGSYARHLDNAECQVVRQHYEHGVLEALETLVEKNPDLLIRPLPMCTHHLGGDDRWFYRRLFRGNSRLAKHLDISLLGAELSPFDYCEAFGSAHVILAMRFHSLVFALGLQVPAVAIDYTLGEGKVQALAARFGVPYQNLAALDAEFIVREVGKHLTGSRPPVRDFELQFASAVGKALPPLLLQYGKSGVS